MATDYEPGKTGRPPRASGSAPPAASGRSTEAMLRAAARGESPAQLIYVHGLGPKPEPAAFKRQWDEALFGRPLGEQTRVAYYADILHPLGGESAMTETLGMVESSFVAGDTSAETTRDYVRLVIPDDDALDWAERVYEEMMTSPAVDEGADLESVLEGAEETDTMAARAAFTAKVLPPGRLRRRVTQFITRAFIQDVAAYFYDEDIRRQIQQRLRDLLVDDERPYVLVTHSMGTIVSYDVLHDIGDDIDVPLWLTIGSPLGIDEVQDNLEKPLQVPAGVGRWDNFADRLDPVALDPELTDEFDNPRDIPTQDRLVLNPHTVRIRGFNPHSGIGYLSHSAVQSSVRDVVGRNFSAPTINFVMASDIAGEVAGPPQRHHVLIELDANLDGDTLEERRLRLKEKLEHLAGDEADAAEVDCLQRYVAANLTPHELQVLRAEYRDLAIHRLWKNNRKAALLKTSTHRIQARTAQLGYQAMGHGIGWAVLDTGIAADHPHFSSADGERRNIESQWDCTRPGVGPQPGAPDVNGHGTHVAGIIAGQERDPENPQEAYYSIAPLAELHVYKVLNDNGNGRDSWIIKALDHVAEVNETAGRIVIHGVNLSLGGAFDPEVFGCGHSPICKELRRLWRMGVVVCIAAGNEGVADLAALSPDGRNLERVQLNADLSIGDPANLEDAIAVGSVHKEYPHLYGVSYFSSRGPTADGRVKPDVVAPGEKIMSASAAFFEDDRETWYVPASGTSMACPHVSGVIAAFLSVRREFIGRPDEVKRLLMQHAIDINRNRYHQGAGMPNLVKMLSET